MKIPKWICDVTEWIRKRKFRSYEQNREMVGTKKKSWSNLLSKVSTRSRERVEIRNKEEWRVKICVANVTYVRQRLRLN